jgi:hypothetical protein
MKNGTRVLTPNGIGYVLRKDKDQFVVSFGNFTKIFTKESLKGLPYFKQGDRIKCRDGLGILTEKIYFNIEYGYLWHVLLEDGKKIGRYDIFMEKQDNFDILLEEAGELLWTQEQV